ncbi:MAG: hypothetical protein WB424_00385 [Terracidiphilus sp.]
MRGSICGVFVLAVVVGLALPVVAQVERGRTHVEMAHPRVTPLPYTAEYKTTRVRTLADGSLSTRESTEVVAVDAQGRRMTSTTTVPLTGDQTPVTRVTVFDPIAHTNTSWTVPGQRVTVLTMPAPGALRPACAPNSTATSSTHFGATFGVDRTQPYRPNIEDLGTDTILGLEARGRRTVTMIPAGKVGNDTPTQRTSETWTAITPGLAGLVVRQVTEDPLAGKTNKELVNFTQAEPDAALFQPPADYEVVNKEPPTPSCPGTTTSSPSTEGSGQSFTPIAEPPALPEQ